MSLSLTRRAVVTGVLAAPLAAGAGEPLASEPLLADAEVLRQAYGALHPGLLRYNTPAQMAGRFAALRQRFARPTSEGEAYLALAGLTAAIRCGHSYPNPYNQKKAVRARLFAGTNRLPFHFAWASGRMLVLRDFSGLLAAGAVIEAVNGVPTPEILRRLMPLSRADGHNDAKRVRNLEVRGEGKYEAADLYLPFLFPTWHDAAALKVRLPDGRGARVEVPLITAEARAAQTVDLVHGDQPAWTLTRTAGGSGVMTMPSWALYDSKWDWKSWLHAAFDTLASERAPGLILDLRGNEGGLDVGNEILSRLISQDLRPVADRRLVRYRKTPEALNPYLDTWDDSFKDWGQAAEGPDANGFYRLTRYDDDAGGDVIRPRGPRYAGKVAALIDASNSSATFQFSEAAKDHGLVTLVGQPNGGNRRGINGGAFFFLRLPGSGLEVDLPLIGRFPVTPQPDAGVAPNVPVRNTAADVAAGYDREMAVALKLIG